MGANDLIRKSDRQNSFMKTLHGLEATLRLLPLTMI